MERTVNPPTIDAITVCVDYSDHLKKVLSNKKFFDSWTIVTHMSDKKTISLCKENNLTYICSDRIYSDGAKFAKGRAINDGLSKMNSKNWVLHIDSDTLLPDNFREYINAFELEMDCIYGCERIELDGRSISEVTPEMLPISNEVIGFFQLWHSSFASDYPEKSDNAAHDDFDHFKRFEKFKFFDFKSIDVSGERCKNHDGRGPVGRRKYLIYGK